MHSLIRRGGLATKNASGVPQDFAQRVTHDVRGVLRASVAASCTDPIFLVLLAFYILPPESTLPHDALKRAALLAVRLSEERAALQQDGGRGTERGTHAHKQTLVQTPLPGSLEGSSHSKSPSAVAPSPPFLTIEAYAALAQYQAGEK